jgi:thiamine biosynthesis lipoprotein ApbE
METDMGTDMQTLRAVAAAALEAREARWSRFRPTSELCRINAAAGAPVVVSRSTFSLIERARDAGDVVELEGLEAFRP